MASLISALTHLSGKSQKVLEEISKKSENKIFRMEGDYDQEQLNAAWTALGAYLSRQLRLGRGVTIPKFGVITFTAPSFKLEGVTNPKERDIRKRRPIFIISKDFGRGINCKPGMYTEQGIRPHSMTGVVSGLGVAKINYTEIGSYCNMDKDEAKICVEKFIYQLSEKARAGHNVEMDIPNVGTFYIRRNTAAIAFNDFLVNDVLDITNKQVKEQKLKKDTLTVNNLQKLLNDSRAFGESELQKSEVYSIDADEGGKTYLKLAYGIDIDKIKASNRPKTAGAGGRKTMNGYDDLFESKTGKTITVQPYSNGQIRPQTAQQRSEIKKQVEPERAVQKVKAWIAKRKFLAEEAFLELASFSLGSNANIRVKLALEEFEKGIDRAFGLELEKEEIIEVFKTLDVNNEGTVDLAKWKKLFVEERPYISYIREFVATYNLQTNDVLRKMALNPNHPAINHKTLMECLIILDPKIGSERAYKVAEELLNGREEITIRSLVRAMGCPQEIGHVSDEWYHSQLRKVKKNLRDLDSLRVEFEKVDTKNQGLVDIPQFKEVLSRSQAGLNTEDLKRFVKYIDKDLNNMIDYYRFISSLEDIPGDEQEIFSPTNRVYDRVHNLSLILWNYLRDTNWQPGYIVTKVQIFKNLDTNHPLKRVLKKDFVDFIDNKVFKDTAPRELLEQLTERVDIDRDGYIGEFDIATFLSRYAYAESKQAIQKTVLKGFSGQSEIFPKVPLPEEKVDTILRDIRSALAMKNITFYDFVKSMDPMNTGFVVINDFSTALDKVIKLSQPVKDGLFAYADTMKIGMIDQTSMINFVKRTVLDKKKETQEDNFDWQYGVIAQMQNWVRENKLRVEEAFRIIDTDFDGFASIKDIRDFLKNVLKIPGDDITSSRLDRLFKLMDLFKRDRIQVADFRRIIEDDMKHSNNATISGGKKLIGRSTFDWKLHARQQIGLFVSRNSTSTLESFKSITGNSPRMTFKQFTDWIEKNQILHGFNLTEKLMQQLFADLDPHKKGYLSDLDWENGFGAYDSRQQVIAEILEALVAQFGDVTDAFNFFLSYEQEDHGPLRKEFGIESLSRGLNALCPKRFTKEEAIMVWKRLTGERDYVDLIRFGNVFRSSRYAGTRVNPNARTIKEIDTIGRNTYSVQGMRNALREEAKSKNDWQEKVVDRMRHMLAASNIPLEEFVRSIDTDGDGDISNLEFVNAMRKLNLGLSLKEIDELLMYFDKNQDGKITFDEMLSRLKPPETDYQIFDRSKHRLKLIKDNIYSYMLSPKDAFVKFNEDRTGKLTYLQFNKFINSLCTLAREPVPSFSIIKNLFDFIDIRKDGIIDLGEWMQSFRIVENEQKIPTEVFNKPTARPQTAGAALYRNQSGGSLQNTLLKRVAVSPKKNDLIPSPEEIRLKSLELSKWECSKEYDEVIRCIARNRRVLMTSFKDLENANKQITIDTVKGLVKQVLNNNNLKIDESFWPYLLRFAEKDGRVDYKFMFDVFKERAQNFTTHPKISTISYS